MQFLSPALAAALFPLLFLPVLIHLLNRRFPKNILFSSVERIRNTRAQRSKLFRWRHWILTLLRSLAIVLLFFAFLRPVLPRFGSDPNDTALRRALVLVDHSLSMEHETDLVTARTRALTEARQIVRSLDARTPINVILVARQPRACFFDFSPDPAGALAFLEDVPPGTQAADFNKAIASAANMIQRQEGGAVDVYFISDFQRENWAGVHFDSLPESSRVFFVGVAEDERENRAILDAQLDSATLLAGETVDLNLRVGNFSDKPLQNESVELILDRQESREIPVDLQPWSQTTLTVPFRAPGPGRHEIELSLGEDRLAADNVRRLTLEVLDKEEVVLASDRGGGDPSNPMRFVATALNPYPDQGGSLLPRQVPGAGLDDTSLATTDKLILLGLDSLETTSAEAIARFLKRGGGVLYFLDGEFDAGNVAAIANALGEDRLPLSLVRRENADHLPGGAQRISRGEFRSRFLRLFRGTNRENLAALRIYKHYQAISADHDTMLLEYGDGTPALV